jgi:hypothetical protein
MRKKEACEVGVHPFVPVDELTRAGESEPRLTVLFRPSVHDFGKKMGRDGR